MRLPVNFIPSPARRYAVSIVGWGQFIARGTHTAPRDAAAQPPAASPISAVSSQPRTRTK